MKASKRKSGSESTQKSKSQRALVDGSVSESTVDDSGPVKLFTSWLPLAFFSETICSGIASHFISFCVLVAPSVKCHRSNHLETHQSIDRYLARTLNTEATEDSNRSV